MNDCPLTKYHFCSKARRRRLHPAIHLFGVKLRASYIVACAIVVLVISNAFYWPHKPFTFCYYYIFTYINKVVYEAGCSHKNLISYFYKIKMYFIPRFTGYACGKWCSTSTVFKISILFTFLTRLFQNLFRRRSQKCL